VKCPYCREETVSGEPCTRCGKKFMTSKGMKVEYKDFKGSELLDIQMIRRSLPGPAVVKPEPEQRKVAGPKKAAPSREKPVGNNSFFVIAAVVIILAAIAGFYLLRFLGLLN
jgi:hypothetical protein